MTVAGAVRLRLWVVDGAIRKQIFMQFASNFSSPSVFKTAIDGVSLNFRSNG